MQYNYLSFFYDVVALHAIEIIRITFSFVECFLRYFLFWVIHSLWVFSFLFTVPATTAVQNVLINPSMIGPKNILITTNMVSSQNTASESNPLKRKHEDDDDNDTM